MTGTFRIKWFGAANKQKSNINYRREPRGQIKRHHQPAKQTARREKSPFIPPLHPLDNLGAHAERWKASRRCFLTSFSEPPKLFNGLSFWTESGAPGFGSQPLAFARHIAF